MVLNLLVANPVVALCRCRDLQRVPALLSPNRSSLRARQACRAEVFSAR